MHTRDDLGCTRGYEGWILSEARKRNPAIKTWGLSWGVPAWIGVSAGGQMGQGSYFSRDNIHYQTQWLKCMNDSYGVDVNYIGIWNERSSGPMEYSILLRQSLDAAGFANTKIVFAR